MSSPKTNGREPVYLKLANALEGMIANRSLRPGERVPSVRQFSRQQNVSVPTALQAYATLETRGLIEARPKTGRLHQIRVHMAAIGCMVVGDALYATPGGGPDVRRLCLHAADGWQAVSRLRGAGTGSPRVGRPRAA